MYKQLLTIATIAILFAAPKSNASGGTTAVGDEAREVFNTLIDAGATKLEIPEGPTVVIDELRCYRQDVNGTPISGDCTLVGDPKLKSASGAIGLRLVKALVAMGIKEKKTGEGTAMVGVTGLDCGILHNVGALDGDVKEEASCYFVDMN